jgi:hypothetical protein
VFSGLGLSILTVVALAVGYQVRGGNAAIEEFQQLDPNAVLLAIALHVAAHAVWAARQWCLARGVQWHLGYFESMKIITAGVFAAAVTPARVGGDGLRLAMLRRHSPGHGESAQVVLSDRALDLLYFIGMGLVAAVSVPVLFGEGAAWVQPLAFAGIVMFALALVLIILLVASRRLLRVALRPAVWVVRRVARHRADSIVARADALLDETRRGLVALLSEHPWWLLAGAGLTALTWTLEFSILWVLLHGFGHEAAFVPVVLAALLLSIITSLPITPGGSGIAEIGALALYSAIVPGVTPAFVLVWRAVTYYYDLAVGGIVTLRSAAGWFSARADAERGNRDV